MADSDLIATGIPGLDTIFLGGIRRGNLILVEGAPGSGKSLLGLEFIYRGATLYNEPGLIVVFETDPDMLLRDAAAFGWDFAALQQQHRLTIIVTSPQVLDQELRAPDSVLLQTARDMGARRIFIDSIALLRAADGPTPGAVFNGPGSYRALLQQLLDGLRREHLTGLVAHETGVHGEPALTLEVAETLADTVIALQRGRRERGIYRTLEIVKSRGQDFDAGEHTLRISAGQGLEVFRRVQAALRDQAPQPTSTTQRSAIGMALLDTLMGGGLLEGSITLVVGVSGSGKSILGYQVAVEGATQLGKRSLVVSLDEHPAQILRNAELLGLGLQAQVEAGLVHLFHASPLEVEVDVHYALLCRTLEAQQIERLVVDGLTTIRHALHDDRRFREFVHGLLAFTKARQITTVLCYETPEVFGISRFMPDAGVSSVVDNIILLNFVELGDQLHRAMTVVKARGSAQSLVTREYQIGPGGLTLTPLPDETLPTAQPFGGYYNLVSRAPSRVPREFTRDDHGRDRR